MSTSFNRQKSNEKQTADSTNVTIEHKKPHRSEHVSSHSKDHSSNSVRPKRSVFSLGPSLVQSNLVAESQSRGRQASKIVPRARPFEEILVCSNGDADDRVSIPIKTDGKSTSSAK